MIYQPCTQYKTTILNFVSQEAAKALKKRNSKVFSEILDSIPKLTHLTTWSECQQLLLDMPQFTEDQDLLSKHFCHLFYVNSL